MADEDYIDGDVIHDTQWKSLMRGIQTRDGIVSGTVVSQQTPTANMTIRVTAGVVIVEGYRVTHAGNLNLGPCTAPSSGYRKWAMVSINSAGTVVLTEGTQIAEPLLPSPPDLQNNETLIALIFMYNGITEIIDNDIRLVGIQMTEITAKTPATWVVGEEGTADEDYTVDGVADEVQINAAITAASLAGGGVVILKNLPTIFNYTLAAKIQMKSLVTLKSMHDWGANKAGVYGAAGAHNVIEFGPSCDQAKIEGIFVFPNGAQGAGYGAILIEGNYNEVKNCYYEGGESFNIKVTGSSNKIRDCNGNIAQVDYSIQVSGGNNVFEDSVIWDVKLYSNAAYNTFINCEVSRNRAFLIYDTAEYNRFLGCTIGLAGGSTMQVGTNRNSFNSCKFFWDGAGTQIWSIEGSYNAITCCSFKVDILPFNSFIRLTAASIKNIVVGNTGLEGITSNLGTGNVVASNT